MTFFYSATETTVTLGKGHLSTLTKILTDISTGAFIKIESKNQDFKQLFSNFKNSEFKNNLKEYSVYEYVSFRTF